MDKTTRNIILAVATLSGFAATLAASGIVVAIEPLEKEFDLSAVVLTWIPLTYILAAAAGLMAAGRLGDIFGLVKVFSAGLLGFGVLNLAAAFSPSGAWLIGLRTAQGLAASLIFATNIALATISHPPEQRGRALGILTAGVYLGVMAGPFLGGVMVEHLGWRSLFLFVGGLTVLTFILTVWKLHGVDWRESRQGRPFDGLGSVIWAIALPSLLMGFTLLPDLTGILLAVGGAMALGTFLWWETHAADPVLNVSLLRHNRAFALSNAAALINYSATYANIFVVTLYLEYILGLSPAMTGYVLVCGPVMQTLVSPFAGRLADRVQPRLVAATGQALCVLGLLSFMFLGSDTSLWYVIPVLAVLGVGFGLFASPVASMVMGSVDKRDLGMASATLATMRVSGQGFSMGISGLVIALFVGQNKKLLPADYPDLLTSARVTFGTFAVLCVLGLIAILLVGKPKDAAQATGPLTQEQ